LEPQDAAEAEEDAEVAAKAVEEVAEEAT